MRPSVVRLDLCKRLFELSGWNTTIWSWYCDEAHDDDPALNLSEPLKVIGGVGHFDHQYPAYDIGYLLRALQDVQPTVSRLDEAGDPNWHAWAFGKYGDSVQTA